jgi:hypothetical protein
LLFHISHFTFHISKIFVLLTLFSSVAIAQDNFPKLRTKLDRVFARVDKSQIPFGTLEENSFGFMNLWQVHTGANFPTDSTHAINSTVWRATYSTLETGKINNNYSLPPLATVNQRINAYRQANPTYNPIMLLEAGYSSLDTNAVRDNLFTVSNGQLRDVAGRSRSPYLSRKVIMASAEVQDVADSTTVIIPSSLVFSNINGQLWNPANIESAILYYDGGSSHFLGKNPFDKPILLRHTKTGIRTIRIFIDYKTNPSAKNGITTDSYSSGYSLNIFCHLRVLRISPSVPASRTAGGRNEGNSTGNAQTARYENQDLREFRIEGALPLPLPPIFPAIPLGEHYGARLQIRLSQTNNLVQPANSVRLRKPLIVVEGYDNHTHNPFVVNLSKNTDMFNFLGIDRNGGRTGGLEWATSLGFDLNQRLDLASYDLIYVDYVNGTDDITRNAKMFAEVLRWVNARKENNAAGVREENVVLGLSMGGLVGRYGLAEMEKNRRAGIPNNDHETRMLITHDSPHRGANVPISMQSLVETFRPLVYAVDIIVKPLNIANMIDNPANKQMAIYRTVPIGALAAGNILYQKNTWLDETYRPMVTFPAAAPAPYQFIALSNGSECGTRLQPPFNHLTTNRYSGFIQPIPWLAKAKITTEMMMRGLPDRQVRKIYNLGIYFTLSLFGGWIEIDQDLVAARGFSHSDMLPIDGMAGGTEDAGLLDMLRVEGSTDYQTPSWIWFAGFERFNESVRNYCFIPKYSALDIRPDVPVDELVANRFTATQTPSKSTANRIFTAPTTNAIGGVGGTAGSEFNQRHLLFTNRNANFIFSQMEPTNAAATLPILDCFSALCDPDVFTINSSLGSLCFGASRDNIFSVKALPTPATVAWTASNNLVTLNFQTNPNQVIVTPSSATARGWVTITADISAPDCNNFTRTLTRQVWVGAMQTMTGFQSRVLTPRACEKTFRYTARNAAGGERLIYTYNAGLEDESSNEGYFDVTVPYGRCLDFTLTVNAVGACGDTQQITRSLRTCSPLTPPGQAPCMARVIQPTQPVVSVKAYPNPTADKLNLAFENLSSPVAQISVQNSLGVKVLETTKIDVSKENITSLDLGHLPDGLYVLTVVFENGERSNVKVVVQKGNIAN